MPRATYIPQRVIEQAALFAWITGVGAVTPEALAERDRVTTAIAAERLDEAVSLGLLNRQSVLVGYPSLYVVTAAGRKCSRKYAQAGGYAYPKGLRTARINIKDARHTIACAGVIAALERRYPDCRVIGERELHLEERERERRLATVEIRSAGRRRSHSPDIVIWPPAADGESSPVPLPVAVEVELTSKAREELVENSRAWARCRHVEAVLYFAETRKIEEQLLDVIEECRGQEMIVVNPLSEVLQKQPGFPLTDQ
jgi:hypothetical protein